MRTLAQRYADFVNLKDFGAVGDGTTNDLDAWNAWQAALANGGVGYIPAGEYRLVYDEGLETEREETKRFLSGCIGNGRFKDALDSETFDDIGGWWRQVSRNPSQQNYLHPDEDGVADDDLDNREDMTVFQHQVDYCADNAGEGEPSHIVCGPIIKTQSIVEYNQPEAGQNYGFGRVIGAYHEGIGKGVYNQQSDAGGTGGFTVFGATAHNKFAGQFGMTAVTGQVWNASEAENPNIELYQIKDANDNVFGSYDFDVSTAQYVTEGGGRILRSEDEKVYGTGYGASKLCGGYFPVHPRSRFANGGYYIGIETGLSSEADELEDVPYTNNDSHTFDSWICGYHCGSGSNKAPATDGILIDGSPTALHTFWNGIVIGSSSMKINGLPGVYGTVGINFASWKTYNPVHTKTYKDRLGNQISRTVDGVYGDICIKYGRAGRYHHFYKGCCSTYSSYTAQESYTSNAIYELACADGYNCGIYFNRGANEDRAYEGDNAKTFAGKITTRLSSGIEFLTIASAGDIAFRTTGTTSDETYSYLLTTYAFAPVASNISALGTSGNRWNNCYLSHSPNVDSDSRLKTEIASVPDAVLDAWGGVDWRQYRLRDSVNQNSAGARLHTGLVAQDVASVFSAAGLDVSRYGLFCHDEWDERYEDRTVETAPAYEDENGDLQPAATRTERVKVQEAGDRYSVRYEEAVAMEAAYLRREIPRIKAHVGMMN